MKTVKKLQKLPPETKQHKQMAAGRPGQIPCKSIPNQPRKPGLPGSP